MLRHRVGKTESGHNQEWQGTNIADLWRDARLAFDGFGREWGQNCPYVFQNEGRQMGEFRKTWVSACKRAEVTGLLFHDLRRSAIRNMRQAGIQENVAMQISGHRTRSVFDRYDIVSSRDSAEAAMKMEERLDKSLGTILGTVGGMEATNENTDTHSVASKRLQ